MINLFQPLLEAGGVQEDFVLGVMIQHARRGVDLLIRYQQLYTGVYQSPLQLFVVVHICDALVHYDSANESTPDVIRFCLETLQDARVSYAVAGPLQKMFCLAIEEYGLLLPDGMMDLAESLSQFGPEEMLEACTRISYRQPTSQIQLNLKSGIAHDFAHTRTHLPDGNPPEAEGDTASSGKQIRMQIKSLLNS